MFITDVGIAGYQSLYRVGLKLGQFTVIYGESDVGKSAFYRALRALFTCESGDSFISKGLNKSAVVVRLKSGERVAWVKRRGKSAEYRLSGKNGDKSWRRNRALPSELDAKFKIIQLIVDNEKFYPNLRGQFDRLFLLFESSSRRARVLGALISNILLTGIRTANVERNRNEADVRAMESLIEDIDKRDKFNWVTFVSELTSVHKVLTSTSKGIAVHERLQTLLEQRDLLSRWTEFSVDFLKAKFFSDLEKVVQLYLSLHEYVSKWLAVQQEVARYDQLISLILEERTRLHNDMERARKELTITCPHCKKSISILDVKL